MVEEELSDPWHVHSVNSRVGGPEFGRLLQAVRDLQDRFAGALPPADRVAELADRVASLAAELERWQKPERQSAASNRKDLPGRGNPLLPPVISELAPEGEARGRVTFGRYYLGGGGAAHGGTIPLLFDELFGWLTNTTGSMARTAYLHVDYRKITRLGVEHRVEARLSRTEGRKIWATGRLLDPDGAVTAEAEGLFIVLLPGQP
jgi:acyl-coenzyme A thioesterase PaaI-like protein